MVDLENDFPGQEVIDDVHGKLLSLFTKQKPDPEIHGNISFTSVELHLTPADLSPDYKNKAKALIPFFNKLTKTYSKYSAFVRLCNYWICDCYILLRDYKSALGCLPRQDLFKADRNTYIRLNLKYLLKQDIDGHDLLTGGRLDGLTVYVHEHPQEYLSEVENELLKLKETQGYLLEYWRKISINEKSNKAKPPNPFEKYHLFFSTYFILFNKTRLWFPYIKFYEFFKSAKVCEQIAEILRNAENNLRIKKGLPKIGEGWLNETELYNFIKNSFPNLKVIHHYRAPWLKRQHLDVFIPEFKVAIEFQGEQHFEPVEFFGGAKNFEQTIERDKAKRIKCRQNNVSLIEATFGYEKEQLLEQIKKCQMK